MRTSLQRLGRADRWTCWLCGGDVPADAPPGSPWAASVDHVVPRSRRGEDASDNRRLAHRRCNTRRGNAVPELRWPADLPAVEAADLFETLHRLSPGEHTVAALVVGDDAAAAARAFVVERATLVLGGTWEAWLQADRDWTSVVVRRLPVHPSDRTHSTPSGVSRTSMPARRRASRSRSATP